jgi:dynactin 1
MRRSIAVMRHVGEVYLGNNLDAFAEEAIMRTTLVLGSLDNMATIVASTKEEIHQAVVHPAVNGDKTLEADDSFLLFERNADATLSASRSAKTVAGRLLQTLRDMKTRSLSLNPEHVPKLDRLQDATNNAYNQFYAAGIAAHSAIYRRREVADVDHMSYSELSAAIQQSSLDSQSADVYPTQSNLRSVSNLLNELVEAAGDFGQLVEFERNQAPWVVRSKELESNKVVSVAAADEIKLLKRDLSERATMLKVKQQEMEEVKMRVDLLEKRNKEAASKLERLNDLERAIGESAHHEKMLEQQIEEQTRLAKTMEEERDGWMRKVAEGSLPTLQGMTAGDETKTKGEVLVGSSAEMDRLRNEISMLQEANRFLRKQVRKDYTLSLLGSNEELGWLKSPLTRRQTSETQKLDVRVEEANAVLRNIAQLPLGTKPLRIDFGLERSMKKEGKPAERKETAKYQIIVEEFRKVKAWEPVRIAGVDMSVTD